MGKNVVLVGFMGTGKSVVGKILAEKMERKFVDLDEEIVKDVGMTINDIFEYYGEDHFRDLESKKIEGLSSKDNLVIATGGGALIREENVERLREKGVLICLTASAKEILRRVENQTHRPLLNVEDKVAEIERRLKERQIIYSLADMSIDSERGREAEIAGEVFRAFEGFSKR